jgi:microcystin-dependent protein
MSEPFLAEVRIIGFNFAPRGWAFCDGQILPINQNQSLYSLLGTTYGGDGRTSFALPDLRGRAPMHVGSNREGSKAGEETHTLTTAEIPAHTHTMQGSSNAANTTDPHDAVYGVGASGRRATTPYTSSGTLNNMKPSSSVGGQAHNNMQPYLAVNFAIALRGLFPSRN